MGKFEKKTIEKIVGDNLRTIRKKKKLTQKDVASLMYIDPSTYTKWETGKQVPNLHVLLRLSQLFSVSLQDLLNGVEDAQKE